MRSRQRKDKSAGISFVDVDAKGVPMLVALIHEGQAPKVEVDGDALKIGGQTYRFDGEKIVGFHQMSCRCPSEL